MRSRNDGEGERKGMEEGRPVGRVRVRKERTMMKVEDEGYSYRGGVCGCEGKKMVRNVVAESREAVGKTSCVRKKIT